MGIARSHQQDQPQSSNTKKVLEQLKPREEKNKKLEKYWKILLKQSAKNKKNESNDAVSAEMQIIRQRLANRNKGDFTVPVDLDVRTPYSKKSSEYMELMNIEHEAYYGNQIKNNLPPENKSKGYYYINENNRPFASELSNKTETGNIPSMFLKAFCMHYGLVLRPIDIHHCLAYTLSKFMEVCSEEMREFVVSHEGKKNIKCEISFHDAAILEHSPSIEINSLDKTQKGSELVECYGKITKKLIDIAFADVKDSTIIDCALAKYENMTTLDKVINHVQTLSTIKNYYEFECYVTCGFPFIVLRESIEEWEKLKQTTMRLLCFFLKCAVDSFPHEIKQTPAFLKKGKNILNDVTFQHWTLMKKTNKL